MGKRYNEEEKRRYVTAFCCEFNFSIKDFMLAYPGISKASLYKWVKIYEPELWNSHIHTNLEEHDFVDVSASILEADLVKANNDNSIITLSISDVSITLDTTYNEELLLKVIRSLKKL